MRGGWAAVTVILFLALPTGLGAAASPAAGGHPPSPSTAQDSNLTVTWHPFSLPYAPMQVAYDRGRDRILVSAWSGSQYRLLVLDSSGTTTADWPWPWSSLLLAPVSGYAYTWVPSYPYPHVTGIDPSTGVTTADWYQTTLSDSRFAGGIVNHTIYAEAGPSPDSRIVGFNVTTGAVVWAYAGLPPGTTGDLVADPFAEWLFVDFYNSTSNLLLAVNRSNGSYSLVGGSGTFALSSDGRRLFVCAGWPFVLRVFRVGDWGLEGEGVCDDNPFVVNPINEELATSNSGIFILNGTVAGTFPHMSDPAWTHGGRAVLGDRAGVVGTWDGLPAVNVTRPLLNPSVLNESLAFESVGGINGSSLRIAVDGVSVPLDLPAPYPSTVSMSVAGLPDGDHTLRVTLQDLVGQAVDTEQSFETDATPPRLEVTSPLETTRLPYVLRGTVNDSHLSWVRVNGHDAVESATTWSAATDLRIGDAPFLVEAADAVSNTANLSLVVRYWPLHEDNLTSPQDHVSLAVPPGWLGEVNASLPGVRISLLLVGPAEPPSAATFFVEALNGTGTGGAFDHALQVADERESVLKALGGTIVSEPALDSVDGQPAATLEAIVYLGSVPTHYVVTIVPSVNWSLTYILTMGVPEILWPLYRGTLAWIREGFHIEAAPVLGGPARPPPPDWGLAFVAGALIGGSGLAATWFLRQRRSRRLGP